MKPIYSTRKSDKVLKLYKHKALVRNTAENISKALALSEHITRDRKHLA